MERDKNAIKNMNTTSQYFGTCVLFGTPALTNNWEILIQTHAERNGTYSSCVKCC